MTDQEIIKRKIELKQQTVYLILQEIDELQSKLKNDPFGRETVMAVNERKDEPWRDDRINRVIGYISAIRDDILYKVSHLRDHEGYLTVIWCKLPTKLEMEIVTYAWGCSPVGDGCGMMNVEHRIVMQ